MEILQLKDVSFSYENSKNPVLQHVSLSIQEGQFHIICGKTGCGKTTLLRLLKQELMPFGQLTGSILYRGGNLRELEPKKSAAEIGFVMQKPEQQIVTDKVWHELAFGLENLGVPPEKIRRSVCEMASYFGITQWFYQDVWELSGGQKQLLNLASVMAMNPKVLLLDEPTSQLDPIAASEFLQTLKKLNREFGLTIVMIEHHLEEIFPDADQAVILENGRILASGTPREVLGKINKRNEYMEAMPAAARLYYAFLEEQNNFKNCPLTIREGKDFVEQHFKNTIKGLPEQQENLPIGEKVLEFCNVSFRYERNGKDVLSETSFQVREQEIFCILGANGSGKTTTLKAASGLIKPYSGKINVLGRKIQSYKNGSLYKGILAMLPQDVQNVFTRETIAEEFMDVYGCHSSEELEENLLENPVVQTGILPLEDLYDKHPYDLSGGQQQICALMKVLCQKPKILLLDEPTKGIDAFAKRKLQKLLMMLKETMAIVIVTHDIEFSAETADRCGLFFQGKMVSDDTPEVFFSENTFYTTAANRMMRERYENIVTIKDAAAICRQNGWQERSGATHEKD